MNTDNRVGKCLMMALLLWLAFASLAQAFYNPNSGRWLNRDRIGESGGRNNYAYVGNRPVDFTDPVGLHQFTLEVKPGTTQPMLPFPGVPGEFIAGGTTLDLSVNTSVKKVAGSWVVRAGFTSFINHWSSSPETETHELRHVADDTGLWNEFVGEADPYVDKPTCSRAQALCFQKVVDSLGDLYRKRSDQIGAQFDCDEYDRAKGGKLGRCALAANLKPEADALAISIGVKILECLAIK